MFKLNEIFFMKRLKMLIVKVAEFGNPSTKKQKNKNKNKNKTKQNKKQNKKFDSQRYFIMCFEVF